MTPVTWLRTSYWAGAVADAVIGILILIPGRMGETEFRYPMGLAAALMFGWTVLLVWADRKPTERKAILLITVFPVITGLLLSGIYAVATDLLPSTKIIPGFVIGVILIILMLYSYLNARGVGREEAEPPAIPRSV
jgi:drug/metabolite transporter (DMT)-like permease